MLGLFFYLTVNPSAFNINCLQSPVFLMVQGLRRRIRSQLLRRWCVLSATCWLCEFQQLTQPVRASVLGASERRARQAGRLSWCVWETEPAQSKLAVSVQFSVRQRVTWGSSGQSARSPSVEWGG